MLRRRRRSLWRLALVVVAVVAVVFGTWFVVDGLRSSDGPDAGPTATSNRTARPTAPPTPKWTELPRAQHKVDIDLDALERGPAPRVPWYADGVIHDGEQTTPIRHGLPDSRYEVLRFQRLEGGYAVDVRQPDGEGSWAAVIDREGGVVRRVRVEVTSHDGRYAAWLENKRTVPVVYDMRTGKVVRGQPRGILSLDGFVGAKVLYTARAGRHGSLALWDPATETEELISPYVSNAEQADEDVAVVSAAKEARGESCFGIYSIRRRELLSRLCQLQYPVRDSPYVAWSNAGKLVVFDARTGKGLLELRATSGDIVDVMREPGGALLVKVSGPRDDRADFDEDGTRAALVRCALSGRCELVTKIYPQTDPAVFNTLVTLPSPS